MYPEISPRSDTVFTDKHSLLEVKVSEGSSVNQMHANVAELNDASELK